MTEQAKKYAFGALFVVAMPGYWYFKFWVWQIQHPGVPIWTFFVNP